MDTIIKTAPRVHLNASPAERWQFLQDEIGIRAVSWIDVNKFTEQERANYDASFEEPDFEDTEGEAYLRDMTPRFPTLALAEEWAALEDADISIAEDLQAFWAPGECGTSAFAEIERQRAALMLKEVCP